jgi:hypothetical protein
MMETPSACDHAEKFKNHLLGLGFLDGTNETAYSEASNIDRFGERQEILEEVSILVPLVCLRTTYRLL